MKVAMQKNTDSARTKNFIGFQEIRAYWTILLVWFLLATGVCNSALANISPNSLFDNSSTFLKIDEAFGFDFEQKDGELIIKWDIEPGYYLYKKQFKITAENAVIGDVVYPEHQQIDDEFFGISDVFIKDMEIAYQIIQSQKASTITIEYQGCAKAGLCYPPAKKVVYLDSFTGSHSLLNASYDKSSDNQEFDTSTLSHSSVNTQLTQADKTKPEVELKTESQQFILAEQLLSDQSIFISLGILVLLGLGLAFTPCVYPMYPILSSIVIGKGKQQISTSHALSLSFFYVQGMAITYSVLGLVVALAGVQFQAALQHPVLLSVFVVLFILLALAMFGLYEIQLPSAWQEKLNGLSHGQKQGNFVGVFIMGVVSGLVASPCTTAPLTAVLIVVAQSDSLIFGFFALYALSIGMGIPLILFGVTGGKLLPKAGAWMNVVKVTFGFMMLTVAILFIERFVVSEWTNLLWAALCLGIFTYWFTVNQATASNFSKGVRTLVSMSGLVVSLIFTIQILQKLDVIPVVFAFNSNKFDETQVNDITHPEFLVVRDLRELENKIAQANVENKSVMLDLYADWCVACKEFEQYTFADQNVVQALSDTVWLQADLTAISQNNETIQEAFNVLGLPTILFFNTHGEELEHSRVTGFMNAESFSAHVKNTLPNN